MPITVVSIRLQVKEETKKMQEKKKKKNMGTVHRPTAPEIFQFATFDTVCRDFGIFQKRLLLVHYIL